MHSDNHARRRSLHADILKQGLGCGPDPNIPLPHKIKFPLQAVVIQYPRPVLDIQSQPQAIHLRLKFVTYL